MAIIGVVSDPPGLTGHRTTKGQDQFNLQIVDETGTSIKVSLFVFPEKKSWPSINYGDIVSAIAQSYIKDGEIRASVSLPHDSLVIGHGYKYPIWNTLVDDDTHLISQTRQKAKDLTTWWCQKGCNLFAKRDSTFMYTPSPYTMNNQYNFSYRKVIPMCIADIVRHIPPTPFSLTAQIQHIVYEKVRNKSRVKVYLWDSSGDKIISPESNYYYNSHEEMIELGSKYTPSNGSVLVLHLWVENCNGFKNSGFVCGDWIRIVECLAKIQYNKIELHLPNGLLFSRCCKLVKDDPSLSVLARPSTTLIAQNNSQPLVISQLLTDLDLPLVSLKYTNENIETTQIFKIRASIFSLWPTESDNYLFKYCSSCREVLDYNMSQIKNCNKCGNKNDSVIEEYNFQLILRDDSDTHIAVNVIGKEAREFLGEFCTIEKFKETILSYISNPHTFDAYIYSYKNPGKSTRSLRLFGTKLNSIV